MEKGRTIMERGRMVKECMWKVKEDTIMEKERMEKRGTEMVKEEEKEDKERVRMGRGRTEIIPRIMRMSGCHVGIAMVRVIFSGIAPCDGDRARGIPTSLPPLSEAGVRGRVPGSQRRTSLEPPLLLSRQVQVPPSCP